MTTASPHSTRLPFADLFTEFVHSQVASGVLLMLSTVAALFLANSQWSAVYLGLAGTPITVSFGEYALSLPVQLWINDLLMVVFFFVVGLEIKREMVVGQLSTVRKAAIPVLAALGGMLAPALIYYSLNKAGGGAHGWGIPTATDIAFALGVLAIFGKRVPVGLRVFLTALAIADDLGAVLVIALFYTAAVKWLALAAAAVLLVAIAAAGRFGIRHPVIYVVLAIGVWACVLASGVHATVAGVLVAMVIPVRAGIDPEAFLTQTAERLKELQAARLTPTSVVQNRSQMSAITEVLENASQMRPPGLALEQMFHPFVAFLILPLFAFFNAGVVIDGSVLDALKAPVGLGILLGLVLGKQIGILLFSWLAVVTKQAELPDGVGWLGIYGGSCLAGIGFTMSLFVTELAFEGGGLMTTQAKVAILAASLVAALWGIVVLAVRFGRRSAAS